MEKSCRKYAPKYENMTLQIIPLWFVLLNLEIEEMKGKITKIWMSW